MKKVKIIILLLIIAVASHAQQPPFWNDIQAFKKQDSIKMPLANQVLFIGSSSFTIWTDIQSYFPAIHIINRGFGGSSISDLLMYKEDVIFKYRPKQIVIYCGENDFAANDTASVETVVSKFKLLFTLIRNRNKKIPVAFVSLKPSPARQHLMPKFVAANKQIEIFLKQYRQAVFIDVYYRMLDKDGSPRKDIFGPDNLHMNVKGYAIWQKAIAPYLVKN